MATTRYNPTPNGDMHIGHLYLCLVNYWASRHPNGGRFLVRFDDDQPWWVRAVGQVGLRKYAESILDDLAWFGIPPDDVIYQSHSTEFIPYVVRGKGYDYEAEMSPHREFPTAVVSTDPQYPLVEYYTIEKVIYDHQEGVDLLIRGDDLRDEYALYQHLWRRLFGDPLPKHIYLPRLLTTSGDGQLDSVSKTNGQFKVKGFREKGYSPAQLMDILRATCLKEPLQSWSPDNIKQQPVLRKEDL